MTPRQQWIMIKIRAGVVVVPPRYDSPVFYIFQPRAYAATTTRQPSAAETKKIIGAGWVKFNRDLGNVSISASGKRTYQKRVSLTKAGVAALAAAESKTVRAPARTADLFNQERKDVP